jgi:hypothetical protein
MNLRLATVAEKAQWNEWLLTSHGLKEIPGAAIYHLDIEGPMLLTPLSQLDDFAIRLNRRMEQPVMTFSIGGQARTIAEFWSLPNSPRMAFSSLQLKMLLRGLINAVAEGRVWWGTDSPPERPENTSFLWWFDQGFPLPQAIKRSLKEEPALVTLETSLDLV